LARPSALEPLPAAQASSASPLSADKRLAVLDDLWRHLSEIYPTLEYKGIFGREWIEPTAERVRQAGTDEEFYGLLLELMATLKDTHTRIISYPGQPDRESPPVQLDQIEGKVAVIRADESTGLKPGDVVLTVDDKPVAECLALHMKRICSSTDRGRVRGACGQLLAGPPGTKVIFQVERSDRTTQQITLQRHAKAFRNEPVVSSKRLTDSLGYIRISRWGGPNLVGQFDQALEEFKDTKGLIIDVRGNGGGSDELADQVNGRFLEKIAVSSIDFWREAGTNQFDKTIGRVQPRGPWTYRGRVAVLIDEGCASACEHFVSGMEAIGRVLLVGTPTNGAGGGPTVVTLSDGTKLAISRALGLRANGVVFEGHGIPPHIVSTPSIQDLRDGRDADLELSKAWLSSGQPLPARSQTLPPPFF
jgi:carboxyl-terminal processing protease